MTFNTDEEIGRVVREYSDVRKKLAALRTCIVRQGAAIIDVGFGEDSMATAIRVTETGFKRGDYEVSLDAMHLIRDHLLEFHSATTEKNRLEQCLSDAGLDDLIRA